MYIMFLDVTHRHSDKKWVPQSRSPKIFFAGLPPRTPHWRRPKWQFRGRQPTPDLDFSPSQQRGVEKREVAEAMGRKPGSISALISEMSVLHEPALPPVAGVAGPSEAAAQGRYILFENYKKDGGVVGKLEVTFA